MCITPTRKASELKRYYPEFLIHRTVPENPGGQTAPRASPSVEMKDGPQSRAGRLPGFRTAYRHRRSVREPGFQLRARSFRRGRASGSRWHGSLQSGSWRRNHWAETRGNAVRPRPSMKALLKGSGPFSKLPPSYDPMPLSSSLVFAGLFVFPTHVGREGKPGVSCPVGREASLRVFAEKPDECDAILAEHFVSPFSCPFCWGDRERVGPAPKGKGRFVGGDLQGEPTKQSPAVPQGAGL